MDLPALGVTNTVSVVVWQLFAMGANRAPHDQFTDASVHYLKALQTPEGNWWTSQNRRPPMNSGPFQAAALSIFALRKFGPPAEQEDTDRAVARAAAWIEAAKPVTNQDRVFKLLGLAWANAGRAQLTAAAKALAASQRTDGGWSQLTTMGSDAYATGQALYALNAGGSMPVSDSTYRKGVAYLLRTQATDGSWHVKSRSIWLQPYFESGFPYDHDQWISAAGTAWATMALSMTKEPPTTSSSGN
jgi:hypothetical protein